MSGRVSSTLRGSERLAARRRSRRRRAQVAFGVFSLLLCTGITYGLWQSAVRISDIQIVGAEQSFVEIARSAMQGSYLGIIPRDSIFFFPASRIREDIVTRYQNVAAVSLSRSGLTGLTVTVDTRVPVARWCGAPSDTPSFDSAPDCYVFDANGVVYAATSTMQPLNVFTIYQLLAAPEESQTFNSVIGRTLLNAEKFPAVFDFARQLATFGSQISFIVFRNDEVDTYFENGARVTYLLGDEQNAFTALVSAKGQLDFSDATLKYIDARFPGKIYLKRTEQPK